MLVALDASGRVHKPVPNEFTDDEQHFWLRFGQFSQQLQASSNEMVSFFKVALYIMRTSRSRSSSNQLWAVFLKHDIRSKSSWNVTMQ